MTVRILLVDDHDLFRAGVAALLACEPELEVVGEVGDGRGALRAAREVGADMVVIDLAMPGMGGIEGARRFAAELAGVKVLCVSMHAEAGLVEAAFAAGASGYLLKDDVAEELVPAIAAVMAGETYLGLAVVRL